MFLYDKNNYIFNFKRIFSGKYPRYKLELPALGRGQFGIAYSVKDTSNEEK